MLQTVVETPALLHDAQPLGIPDSVISFFSGTDVPVFLLNIFAKSEKSDLTPGERRALKNILADTVKVYRGGKESK